MIYHIKRMCTQCGKMQFLNVTVGGKCSYQWILKTWNSLLVKYGAVRIQLTCQLSALPEVWPAQVTKHAGNPTHCARYVVQHSCGSTRFTPERLFQSDLPNERRFDSLKQRDVSLFSTASRSTMGFFCSEERACGLKHVAISQRLVCILSVLWYA